MLVVLMRVVKNPTFCDNLIAGISLAYEQMKKVIPTVGFLSVKKGEKDCSLWTGGPKLAEDWARYL